MYLLQTELFGITNRERKPPLKEDAVPSILSYVLEKKVRQANNTGTPVAVAKTSSRGLIGVTWAMFEWLSSLEEVLCCGSNRNGSILEHHLTRFLTQTTSRYRLQYRGYLLPPYSTAWLIWCHSLAFMTWNKMAASRSIMPILLFRLFALKLTTEQIIAVFRYFIVWTFI